MANSLNQINHFVVLMLENRSFDHMLGAKFNPDFNNFSVPLNPLTDPNNKVSYNKNANYEGDLVDPGHTIEDVNEQLYNSRVYIPGTQPTNSGFIMSYAEQPNVPVGTGVNIMNCFDPSMLPALNTLAENFCVCTNWHASVPGPTWPNRFFVHCATSGGYTDNTFRNYLMDPIYKRFDDKHISWNIYFHDFPQSLAINYLRSDLVKAKYKVFHKFIEDAATGNLPTYSFIEPAYFDVLSLKANDQHPPHNVKAGDDLIAKIYNAVRNSPQWEDILFVIIYDEHGGLPDSVLPPQQTVNPDGNNASDFTFDRLGLRVPAVLVSPYIAKGSIDPNTYDHTSLLKTVEKRFNLDPLTKRDEAAMPFDDIFSLNVPRGNDGIPGNFDISTSTLFNDVFELAKSGIGVLENIFRINHETASQARLLDSQIDLIELAKNINPAESKIFSFLNSVPLIETEHEAALFVIQAVSKYLNL